MNFNAENIRSSSKFLVVSYWYGELEKDALKLKTQCEKHKVDYYITHASHLAKASDNTKRDFKPKFWLEMITHFAPKNVVFVDVRMDLLRYPSVFNGDYDLFAVNQFVDAFVPQQECFSTGVVFLHDKVIGFGGTSNASMFVKFLLEELSKSKTIHFDERFMSETFNKYGILPYLRCLWLGYNFSMPIQCHILDIDDQKGANSKSSCSLKNSVQNTGFKEQDIVFSDQEMLLFISQEYQSDRYFHNMGVNLRCHNASSLRHPFKLVPQLGLSKGDEKQMVPLYKKLEKDNLLALDNVTVKKTLLKFPFKEHKHTSRKSSRSSKKHHNTGIKVLESIKESSPFVVISYGDNLTKLTKLEESCQMYNLDYTLIHVSDLSQLKSRPRKSKDVSDVSLLVRQSQFIYSLSHKFKRPVVFVKESYVFESQPTLFYVDNIDFMAYNLNDVNHVDSSQPQEHKCCDPNVLQLGSSDVLYFAYNKFSLECLKLWVKHSDDHAITHQYQDKVLEYIYNSRLFLWSLRTVWLPKQYHSNRSTRAPQAVIHSDDEEFVNKYPLTPSEFYEVRLDMESCDKKPPLNHNSQDRFFTRGVYTKKSPHHLDKKKFLHSTFKKLEKDM